MAKRGRKDLPEADKQHMAERRAAAKVEKASAEEALKANPQFLNPKFWAGVGTDVSNAVANAIRKGGLKAKQAEIKALQRKIDALQAD